MKRLSNLPLRNSSFRRAVLLVAGLALLPASAFAAKVTRGPFLQQTRPTSTLVVVHTDAPATVELRDSKGAVLASSEQTRQHHLRLSGLPPASSITYQLTVDGAQVGLPETFRTPAVPGTEAARHVTLGAIGDMGSGGANERANVRQLQARGVEAVLTVGDNAYASGAPEEWDPKLFQPFAPLISRATLWPVPGDHEYLTPGASGYFDAFVLPEGPEGEHYYSFDWGDLHVAALDTNCVDPLNVATCEPGQMAAWLAKDLAASDAPWKIVTLHRPAVASGRYGPSARVAQALIPIFEQAGVDLVLQGHNHVYERTWPLRSGKAVQKNYDRSGAPVYMTTGGGGDWVYESTGAPPDWSAVRRTEFHFTLLTLDGNTLRVEAIRPDGTVFDQFSLTKDVPPPQQAPEVTPAPEVGQPSTPPPSPSVPPSSGTPSTPAPPGGEESRVEQEQPEGGCSALPGIGLGGPLLALALVGYRRRQRRR
jgi:hypothetical protein